MKLKKAEWQTTLKALIKYHPEGIDIRILKELIGYYYPTLNLDLISPELIEAYRIEANQGVVDDEFYTSLETMTFHKDCYVIRGKIKHQNPYFAFVLFKNAMEKVGAKLVKQHFYTEASYFTITFSTDILTTPPITLYRNAIETCARKILRKGNKEFFLNNGHSHSICALDLTFNENASWGKALKELSQDFPGMVYSIGYSEDGHLTHVTISAVRLEDYDHDSFLTQLVEYFNKEDIASVLYLTHLEEPQKRYVEELYLTKQTID